MYFERVNKLNESNKVLVFSGAETLPDGGVFLLCGLPEKGIMYDFRIVTGDEYYADKEWSLYPLKRFVRKHVSDVDSLVFLNERDEMVVEKYGIESLIMEMILSYGTLTVDAMWRLTNDVKRLNLAGWGNCVIFAYNYPHDKTLYPPASNFNGDTSSPYKQDLSLFKKMSLNID